MAEIGTDEDKIAAELVAAAKAVTANGGTPVVVIKGDDPEPMTPLGLLEKAFGLAVAAAGIVAALGIPAVWVQFSRFHISTHFIERDHIFHAGVIPAALCLVFVAFGYFALRDGTKKRKEAPRVFQVALICLSPAWLVGFLLFMLAALGVMLLPFWALVHWISGHRLETWAEISIVAACTIGIVVAVVRAASVQGPTPGQQDLVDRVHKNPYLVLMFLVIGSGAAMAYLYVLELMADKLAPAVGAFLHGLWWKIGPACSFTVLALTLLSMSAAWLTSKDARERRLAVVSTGVLAVVWWLSLTAAYALFAYPRLPSALGGGKPDQVDVWIEALPPEAFSAMHCTTTGTTTHCPRAYVLVTTSERIIFSDSALPPAHVVDVPREAIKAMTWPDD